MVKTSILAVLIFTAGVAFGGQYISCTFSDSGKTYKAFFNDEEATDLYYQIGSLQVAEKRRKESASQPRREEPCYTPCGCLCGETAPHCYRAPNGQCL